MNTNRTQTNDLLDLARVLLLVQGAILIATTIESVVFSGAFQGGAGAAPLLSGGSAVVILLGRARLRPDRRLLRRLVYVVEGLILATFAVDTALSIVLAHSAMPVVAVFSQFVLPVSVIGLLRRTARAAVVPMPAEVTMEVAA